MTTKKYPAVTRPNERELMTATLQLNYCKLASLPRTVTPSSRVIRFVMRDLAGAPWPLHLSDCTYAWNAQFALTRFPISSDALLGLIWPAVERGLIKCTWDAEWAAS